MIVPRTVIGFISFSNQGVTGSLILFTLLDTRSWTKKGRNNRVQFRISSIVGKMCHFRLRNANRDCHFVDQWTEKRGRGWTLMSWKAIAQIIHFKVRCKWQKVNIRGSSSKLRQVVFCVSFQIFSAAFCTTPLLFSVLTCQTWQCRSECD